MICSVAKIGRRFSGSLQKHGFILAVPVLMGMGSAPHKPVCVYPYAGSNPASTLRSGSPTSYNRQKEKP